jgi:hypothetical protein
MDVYAYVGENETLSNTKADRGVALVPSLSATQEFSVQSNLYDSQYGRVGAGVTSIIVKSGSNAVHGEMCEFLNSNGAGRRGVGNQPRRACYFEKLCSVKQGSGLDLHHHSGPDFLPAGWACAI